MESEGGALAKGCHSSGADRGEFVNKEGMGEELDGSQARLFSKAELTITYELPPKKSRWPLPPLSPRRRATAAAGSEKAGACFVPSRGSRHVPPPEGRGERPPGRGNGSRVWMASK